MADAPGLGFQVPCVGCDGSGCDECGGAGGEWIDGCPHVYAAGVGEAFLAARLAEKGIWPVGGGWMEQTACCVDAVQFVWAEQAHAEAEALKKARQ